MLRNISKMQVLYEDNQFKIVKIYRNFMLTFLARFLFHGAFIVREYGSWDYQTYTLKEAQEYIKTTKEEWCGSFLETELKYQTPYFQKTNQEYSKTFPIPPIL